MKEDKLGELVKTLEASIQLIQSGLAGVRKVQLELAELAVREEFERKMERNP